MTMEDMDYIVAEWNAGTLVSKIAKALGYTDSYISQAAHMLGCKPRKPGRKTWTMTLTDAEREHFIREWSSGVSRIAMANEWGVHDTTISKYAARLGLDRRKPWGGSGYERD